ncbi:MAG TPA: APC family permease [Streptosporangiaceae bacterium]|nr:APC family permease [Streptosporangiaceae bacterium]
MTDRPAAGVDVADPEPTRLEPDAIGVTEDTVIGMAASAPAASVGLTIAGLAMATAYGSGPIIILTAIPMLIIANAYRRLNMWEARCGASFEWVGRAIDPYLGFQAGWLMVAAYILGTISGVEILAPTVLAAFGNNSNNTWGNIGIDTALGLVMLVIAVIGIKITARTQVGMALIEYVILIGFAIAGLVFVLAHHHGTYHATSGWLSPGGVGGHGSAVAGFLIAVFMFTGWDGSIYVNEETTRRRTNPGKAVLIAVALLTVIYTLASVGLQGVVSPAKLQANYASALVYIAQAMGGGGWAKVMALAIALSAIASTGAGIVITARIVYGMAERRVLPTFLSSVSSRFSTPAPASIVVGIFVIAITWVYLLATSVQNAFSDVVDATGLLFSAFYILTALATIVYYRRRIMARVGDLIWLGVLPLAAAGFLGWIIVKSMLGAGAPENWSILGVVGLGVILMFVARFGLRSPFFSIPRESSD